MSLNRRRTAIHEAGHVVMCFCEDVSFRQVTIRPGNDYLDAVHRRLGKRIDEAARRQLWSGNLLETTGAAEPAIRIFYGGAVAVGVHFGKRGRWRGASDDLGRVTDYLLAVYGSDGPNLQAHRRHLLLQTEAILSSPGPKWQTEVLAAALLEGDTLTRLEVANEVLLVGLGRR